MLVISGSSWKKTVPEELVSNSKASKVWSAESADPLRCESPEGDVEEGPAVLGVVGVEEGEVPKAGRGSR